MIQKSLCLSKAKFNYESKMHVIDTEHFQLAFRYVPFKTGIVSAFALHIHHFGTSNVVLDGIDSTSNRMIDVCNNYINSYWDEFHRALGKALNSR